MFNSRFISDRSANCQSQRNSVQYFSYIDFPEKSILIFFYRMTCNNIEIISHNNFLILECEPALNTTTLITS